MSSSPAISLVKPLGRPLKACPYCDHVSPADAKFCGACGAALHLLPCPNCGAVNDITKVSACYRCHQALEESTVQPAALPAPNAPVDATSAVQQGDDNPAARQRPHTAAVIIILIAFAAASYYAYRQRSTLANHEIAPAGNEAKGSVNAAPAPPSAATTAPPVVAAPAAAPLVAEPKKEVVTVPPALTTTPAIVPATPTPTRRNRLSREATAAAPPEAPATRSPGVGIQTEAPRIGPCTDAVAALGLCTKDTAPNPANPPAQKRQ